MLSLKRMELQVPCCCVCVCVRYVCGGRCCVVLAWGQRAGGGRQKGERVCCVRGAARRPAAARRFRRRIAAAGIRPAMPAQTLPASLAPRPPLLSLPAPAPRQVAWQRLRQYLEDDVSVEGRMVATNRGGVIVEVECIRGFCPGSQLGQRVQTFEELLDRTMAFKVTEVDEEKARLMLSNKRVVADERVGGFKVRAALGWWWGGGLGGRGWPGSGRWAADVGPASVLPMLTANAGCQCWLPMLAGLA